eukprot:GHVR01000776.1.p1 GENE.GHVR01000776.1~~GHVR01000776.1.p1  ORF type:complete len:324 (+),score=67.33 GHVR01000776.1:32-1003(+)
MKEIKSRSSVDEKYSLIEKIGEGTYGIVHKAHRRSDGQLVAVKQIRLDHEEEGVPGTAIREISLLKQLQHSNVVKLFDILCSPNELYLIFEYLEFDLKKYMRSLTHKSLKMDSKAYCMSLLEAKKLTFQLINGVAFCHSRRIVHRDLKPQNLLLSKQGELKLADFGLARAYSVPVKTYTHEVVTLWYRAPEILLGQRQYSTPVDVWSVGCIMAEVIRGDALFPGDSEIDTLFKIFKLLGTPHENMWTGVSCLPCYKRAFPQWHCNTKTALGSAVPTLDDNGIDLLAGMLTYDPAERISLQQALQHPWFADIDCSMFDPWYHSS